MQDYFKYDKIQTGTSLFMKSDSDGSKDKQDRALPLGIKTNAKGIDHFTEWNEISNSIDKNKGLRFDDLQPNSLNYKINIRTATKKEFALNSGAMGNIFGDASGLDETLGYGAELNSVSGNFDYDFTDKWDVSDINIIDDIAFVSYDNYTDIHRTERSITPLACRQYFYYRFTGGYSVGYDMVVGPESTDSIPVGGMVIELNGVELNHQVFPRSDYLPDINSSIALHNAFACYDNCIIEAVIDGKKMYFTYNPVPGTLSRSLYQNERNFPLISDHRFADSDTYYYSLSDIDEGSWGGTFRLLPQNPIETGFSESGPPSNGYLHLDRASTTGGIELIELNVRKFDELSYDTLDHDAVRAFTYALEDLGTSGSSVTYKDISISDVKIIKLQPVRKCGKVDVYVRKRGIITAAVGNRITSPGHGLESNDIIKISSALFDGNETGAVDIHPLNGEKFVKKIDDDTFDLYEDQFLEKETSTSNLRTTDGISWACISSSNGQFGQSWDYHKTIFSPTGRNGYAAYDSAKYTKFGNLKVNRTPKNNFVTDKRIGSVKDYNDIDEKNASNIHIDFSSESFETGAYFTEGRKAYLSPFVREIHTSKIHSILDNIPVTSLGQNSPLDVHSAAPHEFYPFNCKDDSGQSNLFTEGPYVGCRFGASLDVKFSRQSGSSKKYTIAIGEPGSDISVDFFGRGEIEYGFDSDFPYTEDRSSMPDDIVGIFRQRYIPPAMVNGKVHIIEMTVDQYGKITDIEHMSSITGSGQAVGASFDENTQQEFPWEVFLGKTTALSVSRAYLDWSQSRGFGIVSLRPGKHSPPLLSRLNVNRSRLSGGSTRTVFSEPQLANYSSGSTIIEAPDNYWDDAASAHWFGVDTLDYFEPRTIVGIDNSQPQIFYVTVQPNPSGGNWYLINGSRNPPSLTAGRRVRFIQQDPSNTGHPFRLSYSPDGIHRNGGSIPDTLIFGTPGVDGYIELTIPSTNNTLYSYCTNHSGMGQDISIVDNIAGLTPKRKDLAFRNYALTNSLESGARSRFGEQGFGVNAKGLKRIDRFNQGAGGSDGVNFENQWYICPWVDSFGKSVALYDIRQNPNTDELDELWTQPHIDQDGHIMLFAGCSMLLNYQLPSIAETQSQGKLFRPVFYDGSLNLASNGAQSGPTLDQATPKIGGIKSFMLHNYGLDAKNPCVRHSGGAALLGVDFNSTNTPHPNDSVGKDVDAVINSAQLSFSKILVEDNNLIWAEHYMGSSKSVIYMQEITGSTSGTSTSNIENTFSDVIFAAFNHKTNSPQNSSVIATNGFGFDIKYKDGLLLTNCLSNLNDFGESVVSHDGIMLYSFDDRINALNYVQRITPSFNSMDKEKYTERLLIDYSSNILDINNVTYEGDAYGSRTWNVRLTDRYEIVSDKILLRDPIEFVIFSKDLSIDRISYEDKNTALSETSIFPYLSFTEHFTNNNVYYDYSAKSEFAVEDTNMWQISGLNTIQNTRNIVSTPVFFLDVLSSNIDNYGDLTVTIEIDENGQNLLSTINKQLDSLTEIVDNNTAPIPKLVLYGKDPRSMIVPNGPISAATNDEITSFTNGIFDYQPGTLSTSDPYYDQTITQPPLFRGGAHDLYFYGSLSGYGVREYIRYGQLSRPGDAGYTENRTYPYARKITKDTDALSPDKDFAACHYGGDKTLGELFDATYNQAGYTNRGIISFATIDGKLSYPRLQSDGTLAPSEYNYLTPYAALFSDVVRISNKTYAFTIPYEAWRNYLFKGSFIKSSADNRPMFSDFTRISHGTLSSLSPFSGTWSRSYDDINQPSYNPKRTLQNGSVVDVPPKFTLAIGFVNTSVTNADIINDSISGGSFGLAAGRNFRSTEISAANGQGSKMPYSIILSDKMSQPDPNLYPVRDDFISNSFVTKIKSIAAKISKSSLTKRKYTGVYNKIAYFKYNNAVYTDVQRATINNDIIFGKLENQVERHDFGKFSFMPFPIGINSNSSGRDGVLLNEDSKSIGSVLGVAKSSAPAHNTTTGVDGTFNKSIQILTSDSMSVFGYSKIVSNYYFDSDSDSLYYTQPPTGAALGDAAFAGNALLGGFDINEPNYLSLSISSAPAKTNIFNTFVQGIVKVSGDANLSTRGVASFAQINDLWIGEHIADSGESLQISGPDLINFTSLYIEEIAPSGDISLSVSAPIATGINLHIGPRVATGDTTLFVLPPIQNTGDTTLEIRGRSIFAGQQTLFTSGIGVKKGFMPIEIEGVLFQDGQMSLHAGHIKHNEDITLNTYGSAPVSGDATLSIGSKGDFAGDTTIHIGTQYEIDNEDISLAIKDTNRPLVKDTTLTVDGRISSISSLTHGEQNYTIARNSQPVDISPNSVELPVITTYDNFESSSNSIVNRTIGESNGGSEIISVISDEYFATDPKNTQSKNVAHITKTLSSNSNSVAFYSDASSDFTSSNEIIKREAYDANGRFFVVANNDANGRMSVNIYDIIDNNYVQFNSKIQLNLGTAVPSSTNDIGQASGGNTSSPFGDSFVALRRAIKDNFNSSFEVEDIELNISASHINDLKISKLGEIAISTRVKVGYSNSSLEEEKTFNVIVLFNASSVIEGSSNIIRGLPTYYTTSYSYNIFEEIIAVQFKHSSAYTLAFDGEDLYFDRRTGQWGQVWKLSQSNNYSQPTQVIDYGAHADALNYVNTNNGIYISEENKKAAFGVPIKIYDDYNSTDKLMFIGAHLFDPYVLNTLSFPHTPNPIGAVYVYRRSLNSSNWTYFGAVYGKGYTSDNLVANLSKYRDSSLSNKQYCLFGYDFDYSEGNLVVSEPGGDGSEAINGGKAYLFEIGSSNITLLESYSASNISIPDSSTISTEDNFGSHIILLNGDNPITFSDSLFGDGVLHSLKSNNTIKSGTQYLESSYTSTSEAASNIANELSPYQPAQVSNYDDSLVDRSYRVSSIRLLNFGENQKKIGIVRRFKTELLPPADDSYNFNLDKLSLESLNQEPFTLFISGPQIQSNDINLAMQTIGRPSGDMSLSITPSPVLADSIVSLLAFNSTKQTDMSLHIETLRDNYIPISISGDANYSSGSISLQVTPIPIVSNDQTLFTSGIGSPRASGTSFISGINQANNVKFATLFIGQEINANANTSLYTVSDTATEAGYSKHADTNTIAISGRSEFGIDAQSTLSLSGPSFGVTTGSSTIAISTPIPEIASDGFYVHSGDISIAMSGSNAALSFSETEGFATLSVVSSIQTTNTASIYIERPLANAATLFVKNLNPTGVVTTVVSGANIVSGVAPLFVKPNELFTTELFVRGYLE